MNKYKNGEYLVDTGWGCGLIILHNDKIIQSANIFKKYIGKHFDKLKKITYENLSNINIKKEN